MSHSQNYHGNRFNNNNLMSQPAQPEADTIEAKMSWEPLWVQVSIQQPDEQLPGKTIFLSSVQLHGFMIWLPNKKMGIIFSCFSKLFSTPPVLLPLCHLSGLLWPHTCLSQFIYTWCSFTDGDSQAPPQPFDGETGYYPDRDSFLLWSFLCWGYPHERLASNICKQISHRSIWTICSSFVSLKLD